MGPVTVNRDRHYKMALEHLKEAQEAEEDREQYHLLSALVHAVLASGNAGMPV